MSTAPIVQNSYPNAQWKTQLSSAIFAKKKTRVVIRGPVAGTVRAKVVAVTAIAPPKPPLAAFLPIPPVTAAMVLPSLPELLAFFTTGFTHFGYTSLSVSYDGKGSGSADNEMHFLLT